MQGEQSSSASPPSSHKEEQEEGHLTDYEKERLRNIEKNQEIMRNLGIDVPVAKLPMRREKKMSTRIGPSGDSDEDPDWRPADQAPERRNRPASWEEAPANKKHKASAARPPAKPVQRAWTGGAGAAPAAENSVVEVVPGLDLANGRERWPLPVCGPQGCTKVPEPFEYRNSRLLSGHFQLSSGGASGCGCKAGPCVGKDRVCGCVMKTNDEARKLWREALKDSPLPEEKRPHNKFFFKGGGELILPAYEDGTKLSHFGINCPFPIRECSAECGCSPGNCKNMLFGGSVNKMGQVWSYRFPLRVHFRSEEVGFGLYNGGGAQISEKSLVLEHIGEIYKVSPAKEGEAREMAQDEDHEKETETASSNATKPKNGPSSSKEAPPPQELKGQANKEAPKSKVQEYVAAAQSPEPIFFDNETFSGFVLSADSSGVLVSDSRKKGNCARFINHSCNPNLCIRYIHMKELDRLPRVAFFARRHIKPREELTIAYGGIGKAHPEMVMPACYCQKCTLT